ncbi:MAG: hypothetical protein AB7I09_13785, partial [Planctomycetota bacterium]
MQTPTALGTDTNTLLGRRRRVFHEALPDCGSSRTRAAPCRCARHPRKQRRPDLGTSIQRAVGGFRMNQLI